MYNPYQASASNPFTSIDASINTDADTGAKVGCDVRVSTDTRCVQFIEIDEEFCKKLDCPSLTMISVKKQIDLIYLNKFKLFYLLHPD